MPFTVVLPLPLPSLKEVAVYDSLDELAEDHHPKVRILEFEVLGRTICFDPKPTGFDFPRPRMHPGGR